MGVSLEQILGYVSITKSIEKVASGIPSVLPDKFMTSTDRMIKDRGTYVRKYGQRQTQRLNAYGNAARKRNLKDIDERPLRLLHTFEEIDLDPLLFKYLRNADSYDLDSSLAEAKRQIQEFSQASQNLRIASVMSALRLGHIYFDSDGNLLPSSTSSHVDVDFGYSANNLGNLNGIINASWRLSQTNIPLQLRRLKKRAAKDHGFRPKIAIYGENVPGYMEKNSYVLDHLARNQAMNQEYLTSEHGEIPNGLFGFEWIPAYEAFYEDQNEANQDLWAADAVVFCPQPDDNWYGFAEGSYEVPKSLNVSASAEAAFSNLETVHGQFGYGLVIHNPVTVKVYAGDTFIPFIKNPDVVYSADVAA